MLRELRIKNFKAWEETGYIKMAPLTLFFGRNSSAKSSIGQFLMALKQTIELADRKMVLYPGDYNSPVQLGSFQEMVTHRETVRRIEFKYVWDLVEDMKVTDPVTGQFYMGNRMSFEATVGFGEQEQPPVVLWQLEYKLRTKDRRLLSIGMERVSGKKPEYKVTSQDYDLKRNQGRPWSPGAPVRFYGFPDEVVAYYQNASFVQELNLSHEKLYRSIYYLDPLRERPERRYQWAGNEPESVGYSGENTVAAILAARGRNISLGKYHRQKPFEEVIAAEMKKMDLVEHFEVSKQGQEYEVKLRVKGSRDMVELPDVGFGISQVLPVLVECFYAPANSIIIMEQPETHLHPSAQAALADVVIDVINSRELAGERNIQLVIETHSEHFLRRLQRRIAEGAIPQENVAAYFTDVSKGQAWMEALQIDEFGNIKNWPDNFFGDEMTDVTEQSKAAMRKRMSQSKTQEATTHA
jgi:predicted ATPase